jgi:hypothetical protein
MRKSENTPAAASRPATKPSKRDAADAMRSATEYLIATRQGERALKAGNPGQSGRSPPPDVLPVLDHPRSLRAA